VPRPATRGSPPAAKRHAIKMEALRNDGSVLSTTVEQRRGLSRHPLTTTEIEQKFRRLAATTLPAAAIDELVGMVGALEREANLHRLTSLIAARAC
jgi:hypothetical protein